MKYTFGSTVIDLNARPIIMGVLNVTPDSFSDGGQFNTFDAALRRVEAMVSEGTDIIDVGGESSRPGAEPVGVDEELRRTIPVINAITQRFPDVPVSIDTCKSVVATQALDAGATIVNDISGGTFDPMLIPMCGARGASLVIMHMQGTPRTMQAQPHYEDVVAEVRDALSARAEHARTAGVRQIFLDVGIGFGKTLEHNLALLRNLDAFHALGFPLVLGVSRKAFIGTLLGNLRPEERIFGTAAAVTAGVLAGVQVMRVHDVRPMREAASIAFALRR